MIEFDGKNQRIIASANAYLLTLIRYHNYLKLINPRDKIYKDLHEWLLTFSTIYDDYVTPMPPLKDIATQINSNGAKIKRHLIKLHEDILSLNEDSPELFIQKNEIPCVIHMNCYNVFVRFHLGLIVVPRIGEQFNFQLMLPKLGNELFYVKNVEHSITKSGHVIDITLTDREELQYFKLLKEKAYFHGWISINEYIGIENEFELEDKLRKSIKNL
jgi:hypothetical protein